MPTVRRFGQFLVSDIPALEKVIEELDETGCEGIVMKPTHPAEMILKYVTLGSCLRDIHIAAPLMLAEMMSEFLPNASIIAAMFIQVYLLVIEIKFS